MLKDSYGRFKKQVNHVMYSLGRRGFDAILIASHPNLKDAKLFSLASQQNVRDNIDEAYLVARRFCNCLKETLYDYGLEFGFKLTKLNTEESEKVKMCKIRKKDCWWSELYTMSESSPHYLYWDDDLKRYRVGCIQTANKHKSKFTLEEAEKLRSQHPGFDEEFEIEKLDKN